ncbi:phosphotransferase family protein [Aspergillus vadensis CBS 113365]|uniref:non-specific serine/threonine protein kinase n=1 Tax=Aspergillus vadensis (strain CBS 113365 / IMI 142717 / IBT 24658) TaxID=1448311 RepID=A0A319BP96_ASPVC|nr:phosphotransferase enzyme family protein [Aspergillus vadensis CBS 113365]PYH75226.1 phosphotransferase enzyme family protein [Aspergillus vadensis CBS 113365]
MSDINHQTYHTRLEQIQRIAQHHSLQITTITPIAYQELGPCPYNNFIYKLELSQPPSSTSFHTPDDPPNPYTTSPPDGTTTYILRMSNPSAMGINPLSSRIENELAAMSLARQGLESHRPGSGSLIPRIHTFCSKPTSHPDDLPWTLMEYKSGIPLDEFFPSQSKTIKKSIIEQVADILAGLRKCPLPSGITYGGLGLSSTDGRIISAEMTTTNGGPWSTYAELLKARLRHELHDADSSPIINGWRSNGIRDRLDSLIDKFSLPGLSDPDTRVLIHGDLTMNNILIDPTTCKLTALIDFDFACIAHPAHEFLVSLQDLGGNVMGPYGEDPTEGKLAQALLSGDFSDDNVPGELWWIGKTFNACLAERGVARPSDIGGMGVLCRWRGLEQCVCPFHLAAEFIVGRMSEEAREGAREGAEGEVVERMGVLEGFL